MKLDELYAKLEPGETGWTLWVQDDLDDRTFSLSFGSFVSPISSCMSDLDVCIACVYVDTVMPVLFLWYSVSKLVPCFK